MRTREHETSALTVKGLGFCLLWGTAQQSTAQHRYRYRSIVNVIVNTTASPLLSSPTCLKDELQRKFDDEAGGNNDLIADTQIHPAKPVTENPTGSTSSATTDKQQAAFDDEIG